MALLSDPVRVSSIRLEGLEIENVPPGGMSLDDDKDADDAEADQAPRHFPAHRRGSDV